MALKRKGDCLRIKDNVFLNFYLSSKKHIIYWIPEDDENICWYSPLKIE